MKELIKQSLLLYTLLSFLTGIAYPLTITSIAQVCWPHKANGSLVRDDETGEIIGSHLLGQEFKSAKYFWSRPSATSPANNAAASSGSNLGPTSQTLIETIKSRVDALRGQSPENTPVPIDLVTSSASGLDPDISVAAARFQIPRVSKARGVSEDELDTLIRQSAQAKQFSLLGESRVNVVKLNLELDKFKPPSKSPSP